MKYLLILFTIASFTSFAKQTLNDSIPEPDICVNNNIDSLINIWFSRQVTTGNDTSFLFAETDSLFNPDFPDSVYKKSIDNLPVIIDLSYNKIVRNYIHMYTHKRRDLVENMLGLSDYYFPFFEQVLDANNMPLELKYLPVIESALNPNAVSRTGATGLWQFMYYTGKMYKLEINSLVDERRDPVKSSYAAAKFLNDLYNIYNDWILVIAAYNCGPGNVNKAIRRSGGKKNYWDIYYHLPRETRGYVPAYIAAIYVMNYYKEHNLRPNKVELPILTDTVMTSKKIHLEQISYVMNINITELRNLNPQYRKEIIPGGSKKYAVRLPFDKTGLFIELEDSISHYKDSIFFNPEVLTKKPVYASYKAGPPTKNHVKLLYTVKSGDNLGFIAEWYGVSVSNIKYWNGLRNSRIRVGQKLTIYVHKSKVNKYKNINTMTFEQKQASIGKKVSSTTQTISPTKPLKPGEYELYTIKRGDTIWEIAKKFPGVTETEIMQWNGITNASKISVGQQLKIKIKG